MFTLMHHEFVQNPVTQIDTNTKKKTGNRHNLITKLIH